MMYLHIAEISATAGLSGDGVVRGSIAQSQLLAARLGMLQATTIYALRRDVNGSDSFVDVSAQAVGTTADGFLPWGADATFSATDELWIAADKDICAIYVEITTPGVWTGAGLSVLESTDGETLVPVGNLTDGSNGLRAAAGVYKISFDLNNANRKAVSPIFGGTKRKYIVLRPNGLTAKTTSPKLRRVWLICADDGITYIDIFPTLSASMASSDFSNVSASHSSQFSVVGDVVYFALPGLSMGLDDAIYRRTQNRTGVYEYLASDGTWKTLQNVSDPGNQLKNGPATAGTTSENYALRWTVPTDWTAQSLTLLPAAAQSAHWIRFRVTSVSPLGPGQTAFYRRRARSFGQGNANGIYHKNATSYDYITFDFGVAPTSDMVIAFANAITGQSRSVTIPSNTRSSTALASARLDFNSELDIGAGEQLLISHVSGGSAQDCEVRMM